MVRIEDFRIFVVSSFDKFYSGNFEEVSKMLSQDKQDQKIIIDLQSFAETNPKWYTQQKIYGGFTVQEICDKDVFMDMINQWVEIHEDSDEYKNSSVAYNEIFIDSNTKSWAAPIRFDGDDRDYCLYDSQGEIVIQ